MLVFTLMLLASAELVLVLVPPAARLLMGLRQCL
jgi:hypothetical protein